jgi:hypothetical protein
MPGQIVSTFDDGVGLFNGGSVINNAGAVIQAPTGGGFDPAGVYIPSGSANVVNHGSITGQYGVYLGVAGTVENAGTISGSSSAVTFAVSSRAFAEAGRTAMIDRGRSWQARRRRATALSGRGRAACRCHCWAWSSCPSPSQRAADAAPTKDLFDVSARGTTGAPLPRAIRSYAPIDMRIGFSGAPAFSSQSSAISRLWAPDVDPIEELQRIIDGVPPPDPRRAHEVRRDGSRRKGPPRR